MSDASEVLNGAAQTQLKSIVDRLERLDSEKSEISAQIKEVYQEVGGNGFDKAAIRKVVARRKKDRARVQEEEAILDLYLVTLGEV